MRTLHSYDLLWPAEVGNLPSSPGRVVRMLHQVVGSQLVMHAYLLS